MDIKLQSSLTLKLKNTNFIGISPILINHIDVKKM